MIFIISCTVSTRIDILCYFYSHIESQKQGHEVMVTQARVSSICNKLRKIFMVKNPGEHWKTNSTISTSNIYDFIFLTHRHYHCLCILHHALLIQISSQTLSCSGMSFLQLAEASKCMHFCFLTLLNFWH